MFRVGCEYNIREDVEFILESEKINIRELSRRTGISRTTLDEIMKSGKTTDSVCEKFYAYIFENRYRLNAVKEELIKEQYHEVLFHGSKNGLKEVTVSGSRENCDFGKGFYLGETYNQAIAFVCENEKASVYSFRYSLEDLKIKHFKCSLEWMLAICYFRGTLGEYAESGKVKKVVS